jgi:transcriptional regulator
MYTPPAYAEAELALLHRRMREWNFATLVPHGASGCNATHLPFLLDANGDSGPAQGTLTTHLARANPQLKDLQAGAEALVIFQGPHAFISPSWYDNRLTFPTWNYTAIHVRGQPRLIEAPADIHAVLRRTVAQHDTPLGGPWDFEQMPETMISPRLRAIVALEIPIGRIEGKMKLNQDKSVADRLGVIAALERQGRPDGLAVAQLMREHPELAGRA